MNTAHSINLIEYLQDTPRVLQESKELKFHQVRPNPWHSRAIRGQERRGMHSYHQIEYQKVQDKRIYNMIHFCIGIQWVCNLLIHSASNKCADVRSLWNNKIWSLVEEHGIFHADPELLLYSITSFLQTYFTVACFLYTCSLCLASFFRVGSWRILTVSCPQKSPAEGDKPSPSIRWSANHSRPFNCWTFPKDLLVWIQVHAREMVQTNKNCWRSEDLSAYKMWHRFFCIIEYFLSRLWLTLNARPPDSADDAILVSCRPKKLRHMAHILPILTDTSYLWAAHCIDWQWDPTREEKVLKDKAFYMSIPDMK